MRFAAQQHSVVKAMDLGAVAFMCVQIFDLSGLRQKECCDLGFPVPMSIRISHCITFRTGSSLRFAAIPMWSHSTSALCALCCTSLASALPSKPPLTGARARFFTRFSVSFAALRAKSSHRPARAIAIRERTVSRRASSFCAGGVLVGSPPAGAQRIHLHKKCSAV